MRNGLVSLGVVLVVALGGCGKGAADPPAGFGLAPRDAKLVQQAKTVEMQLLDGRRDDAGKGRTPWVAVDAATAAELARLLRDPASYVLDSDKACVPQPGVALRFADGDDQLVVRLCFECRILIINDFVDDFDPIAPRLAAIVKQAFPEDEVVKKL